MPAVFDVPDIATLDSTDLERAWQLDAPRPRRVHVTRETAIVVRRSSPHDFQDRQIYLWIDDDPLGKIRYGEAIVRPIEPGRHTIRAFNTLLNPHVERRCRAGRTGSRAMRHRHAGGRLADDDVSPRDLPARVAVA